MLEHKELQKPFRIIAKISIETFAQPAESFEGVP
jgi:hypothetical protein